MSIRRSVVWPQPAYRSSQSVVWPQPASRVHEKNENSGWFRVSVVLVESLCRYFHSIKSSSAANILAGYTELCRGGVHCDTGNECPSPTRLCRTPSPTTPTGHVPFPTGTGGPFPTPAARARSLHARRSVAQPLPASRAHEKSEKAG